MSAARHSIQCLPGGGISLGFSATKTKEECNEKLWWSYLEGGTGIEHKDEDFFFERCYGSLAHELFRHCAVEGRTAPLDPPFKEWCHQEGYNPSASHILSLYRTIVEDLDWYFEQPQQIKIKTLLAEEELHAEVKSPRTGLTHVLRGTPDIVGEVEGEWGGGIYIVDFKTYGVIKKDGKLYVDPPDAKVKRDGRFSSQFPAYMGLWNLLHPDQPIFDGIAHFVPQRAIEAQRLLLGRKGNQKRLQVHNSFVFKNPSEVARTITRWTQACDDIALALDSPDPHTWFQARANTNACTNDWGFECAFWNLCSSPDHLQQDLIAGAWQSRTLVERKEAA